MTTLADIAKKAGVSTAVVSRIMNNDGSLRVSKETRACVHKVIEETGYTPNRSARSLRKTETGMLALVVHDVTNPVYAEIMKGAHAAATDAGKAILLVDAAAGEPALEHVVGLVRGRGVDGIVLQAAEENADVMIAQAARESVPIVLLQTQFESSLPVVALQDRNAAWIATNHLIERGHTNIACLATRKGLSFTNERVAGWKDALKAAGHSPPRDYVIHCDPSIEDGAEIVESLLDLSARPTAVVCCNVLSAIGAMHYAIELGYDVPADIAFVTIHDIPLAQYCSIPLSAVEMPLHELGKSAIELLLHPLPEQTAALVVPTSPKLIHRKSS